MTTASSPMPLPLWQRVLFAIPFFGWIARDVAHGDEENLWYAIGGFVCSWIILVMMFGLPGLYIPAVLLVPVIGVVLILITRG